MDEILIEEVSFYPIRITEKGLTGFASCLFDRKLALNSIAVYTRPDGSDYRLVFPTKQLPNGLEVCVFYPINNQVYNAIKEKIVEKINELTEKAKESRNDEGARTY